VCQTGAGQAGAHLLAKLLKAPLFWQKDETISQTQDRKRRAITQSEVFAKLLRNSELAFLADLGRGQVFENGIVACHR
jgi:hypothetical protein